MRIEISIPQQILNVLNDDRELIVTYSVSTAAKGVGCVKNSECTPIGHHIIRAKIGADALHNAVFIGRRATGEIFTPDLMAMHPNRDWILTRILWLSGTEVGKNRLGNVDTMQRYIYIHGTPDATSMGKIGSHGCIRMRNADIVELFDLVQVGNSVLINND